MVREYFTAHDGNSLGVGVEWGPFLKISQSLPSLYSPTPWKKSHTGTQCRGRWCGGTALPLCSGDKRIHALLLCCLVCPKPPNANFRLVLLHLPQLPTSQLD